jgi:hypothetical protein
MMKRLLFLFVLPAMLLAGCSVAGAEENLALEPKSQSEGEPTSFSGQSVFHKPSVNPPVVRARNAVYWSIKEVRNLSELEGFMESVNKGIKDRLRIETSSKEGDPVVLDLHCDGERIIITSNMNSGERWYDKIVVSERHDQHYQGKFIEYWAVSDHGNDKKELLLQIHPDLAEMSQ